MYLSILKCDIKRTYDLQRGGKVRKAIGCFLSPGVHAVVCLRLGQWLLEANLIYKIVLLPIYVIFNHRIKSKWGIEISRRSKIGYGFYIGHFGGITISGDAVLGNNINISQGVVIGVSGKDENRGCPVLGNSIYIAPGAKIFGKIKIGNNVQIGANAVVYRDIPDNAVVVSYPGYKIILMRGNPDSSMEDNSLGRSAG